MRGTLALRVFAACVLTLSGAADMHRVTAQTRTLVAYVIPIEGTIDLGLARVLTQWAGALNGGAVRLAAALDIRAPEGAP